ncbi:MAG: PQQ-binding-like beta-propeller repeat protein [Myxococcales bacterium]
MTHSHGVASARVVFAAATVDAVVEPDGALGAQVPLTLSPAGVEGDVPFSVELRDDLGHVTALPASVKVDDRAPRVTVDQPSMVLRGTLVSLHVTVEDMSAVTIAGSTRNTDGSFTIAVDTHAAPAGVTNYDVPITVIDAVGNATTVHPIIPLTRLKFAMPHPSGRAITSLVLTDTTIVALADHSEFWFLRRSDGVSLVQPPTGGTAFEEFATDGTRLFFARSDNNICRMGADGSIQLCCGQYATMTHGPILQDDTAIVATTGTSDYGAHLVAIPYGTSCAPNAAGPLADFALTSPAIGPDGILYAGAAQKIVVEQFDGIGWAITPQVTSETPHYVDAPAFRGRQVLLATNAAGTIDTFTFTNPLGAPAPTPTSTQIATLGTTTTAPTIAGDETAVLATDDRHLIALRTDNFLRWNVPLPSQATAPPTHGAGGVLYVGTLSGDILAIDESDGATIWSYTAGAPIRGPLAPGCDGVLYAATDGAVVALVIDQPGLADSAWPKAAHDVRGTGDARRPLKSASGACLE